MRAASGSKPRTAQEFRGWSLLWIALPTDKSQEKKADFQLQCLQWTLPGRTGLWLSQAQWRSKDLGLLPNIYTFEVALSSSQTDLSFCKWKIILPQTVTVCMTLSYPDNDCYIKAK